MPRRPKGPVRQQNENVCQRPRPTEAPCLTAVEAKHTTSALLRKGMFNSRSTLIANILITDNTQMQARYNTQQEAFRRAHM